VRPTLRHSGTVAILVLAVAALLIWLYASTMAELGSEWLSSSDSSYGAILAGISFGTMWTRRRAIRDAAVEPSGFLPGVAILTFGLFLFLIGRFGADVFVTRISLVVVATGALWCVAGTRAVRLCAAPMLFLIIAIPLPTLVVNAITLPLQLVASRMAEWMLASAHIPVFRDGNVLELQSTSLEVAEACSGLRSLISLTAIAFLVAWASECTVWRRAIVIAVAMPIALLLNAIRIAATGAACEFWGPDAARGGWHTFAGWLTFVIAVIVLARVQRALPRASHPSAATVPQAVSA
jgi:exosortase